MRLAAFAVVLGLSVNLSRGLDALYQHPDYQRDDYRAIAAELTHNLRSGEAIILDAPNQEEVFRYYYSGEAPVYPLPPGLGGDDAATQAQAQRVIDQSERIYAIFWGEAERDPNRIVETTLDQGAFEIDSRWYGDVRLARYVTPAEMTINQDLDAQFGESIRLESYALSGDTFAAGDVLQLRLNWRTDTALDTRYKVFVQLLDEQGRLVAQRDSEPGGGLALTTTWAVDTLISDNHALMIPGDLPAAHYALIVGLYDSDDPQQRLRTGETDHHLLTDIQVE